MSDAVHGRVIACRDCGSPQQSGALHCGNCGAKVYIQGLHPSHRRPWPVLVAILVTLAAVGVVLRPQSVAVPTAVGVSPQSTPTMVPTPLAAVLPVPRAPLASRLLVPAELGADWSGDPPSAMPANELMGASSGVKMTAYGGRSQGRLFYVQEVLVEFSDTANATAAFGAYRADALRPHPVFGTPAQLPSSFGSESTFTRSRDGALVTFVLFFRHDKIVGGFIAQGEGEVPLSEAQALLDLIRARLP